MSKVASGNPKEGGGGWTAGTIGVPREAAESGAELVPLKAKVGRPKRVPVKAVSGNPKEAGGGGMAVTKSFQIALFRFKSLPCEGSAFQITSGFLT